MARLVWPARSCTSRRLPPTWETLRAARVMKVRRPECDEQPSIFSEVYSRWNHKRTVAGDTPPPRSEKMRGRSGSPRVPPPRLERDQRGRHLGVHGDGAAAGL